MSQAQEHGSQMAMLRRPIVVEETMAAGITRARVVVECVIDRYHERMQITDRQKDAGLKVRALWRAAASSGAAVTSAYGELLGGSSGPVTQSGARQALTRAFLGAQLAVGRVDAAPVIVITHNWTRAEPVDLPLRLRNEGHVIVAVCGVDEWAGGTQRLQWLREGLSNLADYWGLER